MTFTQEDSNLQIQRRENPNLVFVCVSSKQIC